MIHFNVYGKETRPSNREISFESETVSTVDPEVKFNLDSSKAIGYWSVDQTPHTGCIAQLWKIVKVDGVQQSRDLFNKSNYQSSPKIITIGTKDATAESLTALKNAVATGDEATVRGAVSGLKSNADAQEEEDENKDEDKDVDASDKKDDKKGDSNASDKTDDKKDDKKDEKKDNQTSSDNKSSSDDVKANKESSNEYESRKIVRISLEAFCAETIT